MYSIAAFSICSAKGVHIIMLLLSPVNSLVLRHSSYFSIKLETQTKCAMFSLWNEHYGLIISRARLEFVFISILCIYFVPLEAVTNRGGTWEYVYLKLFLKRIEDNNPLSGIYSFHQWFSILAIHRDIFKTPYD